MPIRLRTSLIALVLLAAPLVIAAPGDLDPSFGQGGIARMGIGESNDSAYAVRVQPDGKIVVAGSTRDAAGIRDFAAARYNTDGSLDPTFGVGGRFARAAASGDDHATAIALQADGKIVLAGLAFAGPSSNIVLMRLDSAGALDPSFGDSGIIIESLGPGGSQAWGVAVQGDGKILVVGSVGDSFGDEDLLVARFNADGSSDNTFGTGGHTSTPVTAGQDRLLAVALQSDGKIVAGGVTSNPSGSNGVIARYDTAGALDTTFNGTGLVVGTSTGEVNSVTAVAIQADGNIVVGGALADRFGLQRYQSGGTLDPSFAGGQVQIVMGTGGESLTSIAIQSDGKIIAAGHADNSGVTFAIARVLANGSLDASYGSGGKVFVLVGDGGPFARGAALQSDGKLVAVGDGRSPVHQTRDFALARLNVNGSLDPAFAETGKQLTDFYHGAPGQWSAVALKPDGRIVAGGYKTSTGGEFGSFRRFAVGVMLPDGSPDPAFGTGGNVFTHFEGNESTVQGVAVQSDGKIVAAGSAYNADSVVALARYLLNGALDISFGLGGKVVTDLPSPAVGRAIAVQPDGKLVVVASTSSGFTVLRYSSDGSLDPAFGSGGMATSSASSADSVVLQPDGKILIGGGSNNDFLVARFNANGTLDTSFGSGGTRQIDAGASEGYGMLALQPDGKIVISGLSSDRFALARLNAAGNLDSSFGVNGITVTGITAENNYSPGLALQSDGKILQSGGFYSGSANDFIVLRYNANGSLDSSFGTSGQVVTHLGNGSDVALDLAVQPDGKAVAVGYSEGTGAQHVAVRYLLEIPAAPAGHVRIDINGDTKSDVFFRKTDGTNYVWHIDGANISGGSLTIVSQGLLPTADASWFVAGMGDFNGDGKADVLWRNAAGTNYVWHLDGASINASVITIVSQGVLPSVDASWSVAGIGDFNGDGKSDIFWRNVDGSNYVWHVDGATINNGVLSIVSQGLLPSVDATWAVAGLGDFNGDAKSGDVLWRKGDGTNYVWHVDGATINGSVLAISSQGLLPGVDNTWTVVATGDYNGDGKSDVFFRRGDGTNYVWHVDGATINGGVLAIVSQGLLPGVDGTWIVVGQGDYNGDGKGDVFWRKDDGTNYVWHVDGATINGGVLAITSQGLLPGVDGTWTVINTK